MKKKSNGFSIIELVVVLAILSILMAIAVTSFGDAFDKSDNAQASISANAINTSVTQILFDEHNKPITNVDLSNATSDLHIQITNGSKLQSGETIQFNYYDVDTNAGLPTLASYTPIENTWSVYLPKKVVQDPNNAGSNIEVFDFTNPVVTFTPLYSTVRMYEDGVEVQ